MDLLFPSFCGWVWCFLHFVGGFGVSFILWVDLVFPSFCGWIWCFLHFVGGFGVSFILLVDLVFHSFCGWICCFLHFVVGFGVSFILWVDLVFPSFCGWIWCFLHFSPSFILIRLIFFFSINPAVSYTGPSPPPQLIYTPCPTFLLNQHRVTVELYKANPFIFTPGGLLSNERILIARHNRN